MHLPKSKAAGIAFGVAGLASMAALAMDSPFRTLGATAGFVLSQFARGLTEFIGRDVHVDVFGRALPNLDDVVLRVDAIECLGLGLWIYLRLPSGDRVKLKIAQPSALAATACAAEITFAGYAQWNSKRVKGPDGRRAPGTVRLVVVAGRERL